MEFSFFMLQVFKHIKEKLNQGLKKCLLRHTQMLRHFKRQQLQRESQVYYV